MTALEGRRVLVPQYLGRAEYRERLRLVSAETGVPFVEVVVPSGRVRRWMTERGGCPFSAAHRALHVAGERFGVLACELDPR